MFNLDDAVWYNDSMRDKLGYYLVNGSKFYNKVSALLEFQNTHDFPKYIFNDEVFSRYDRSALIETDIFDLYSQRVRQLRDKYETIVLSFSGGSDSQTILNAFVKAKVPIDVILFIHAESIESRFSPSYRTYKEIYDCAIPFVNEIKQTDLDSIGKPKIISYDMTQSIRDDFFNTHGEGWSEQQNSLDPTVYYMTTPFMYEKTLRDLVVNKDKSSWCFLRGGEKPFIEMDKIATSYFIDEKYKDHTHWPNCELFFTTPDMPEIHVKQEQLLFANLKDNKFNDFDLTNLHNEGIRDAVHGKQNFWSKGKNMISPKSESLIKNIHQQLPGNLDKWSNEVDILESKLDKRWFDDHESVYGGMVGIKSKGYRFNG